MGRTLAHGRLSKEDPGEAFRQNGLINALGNKGIFGNHMDQLLFEGHGYEHILGSISQVASDFATMTWDQNDQRFEDKSGAAVPLSHYERIAVIGMDTLTDNIKLDNLTGLEIFHIGNTPGQTGDNPKFQLGDAGGEEPFKIKLGPNTKECKLDLLTDKPFEVLELSNLTQVQKQYVANQGKGNLIKTNGEELYNPSQAGQIIKFDAIPVNPYFLRLNGDAWPWSVDAAVNNHAWFRDLNIKLHGHRWNGTQFIEIQSKFTPQALILSDPYLFKLNIANRFFTDLMSDPPDGDTRIHERTDPTGVALFNGVDFDGTNVVFFVVTIGHVKNNMRIQGGTVPGGASATTVLRNINTTTRTAEMYDALTGSPVNVAPAASVVVLVDNSGAAGGSHDEDYFQTHAHGTPGSTILNPTPNGFRYGTDGGLGSEVDTTTIETTIGEPLPPRTHDQTQPKSSGVYYYYKA